MAVRCRHPGEAQPGFRRTWVLLAPLAFCERESCSPGIYRLRHCRLLGSCIPPWRYSEESALRIPVHVRLDEWRQNLPRRHQFHLHSDCGSGVLPWRYSVEQTPQVSITAEFDGTGASSYPPAVRSVAPPRAWTTPGVHLVHHPTDESDLRSAEQQHHQPHGVVVIWFFPSFLVQRSSPSCQHWRRLDSRVDPAFRWASFVTGRR